MRPSTDIRFIDFVSLPYIIFLDIFPIDTPYCHKYSPGNFEIPHGMKKITNTLDRTDSIIHNHTIMRFPFNTITLQCVPVLDLEFNRYIWPLFFSSVLKLTTHVTRYWEVSIVQIWPCVLPLDVPWIVHEILSAMSNSVMWRIRWFESIASQYLLYIISKYVFVTAYAHGLGQFCDRTFMWTQWRHGSGSAFEPLAFCLSRCFKCDACTTLCSRHWPEIRLNVQHVQWNMYDHRSTTEAQWGVWLK